MVNPNSSMALLEGSFLKIPAINVGERNFDRMNGGNVIFVEEKVAEIKKAAEKVLFDRNFSNNLKACQPVYGDGQAAQKIVKHIKGLNKNRVELLAKGITY